MRLFHAILMIFPLLASMADVYNFNVDWRFKKLPMGIAGLPSARKAIAAEGKEFFDRTYPDSDWEMVSVPHAVNAHDSYDGPSVWWGEEKFFRGWMFYRKRFVPPKGRRFFLEFESVRSSVYLWVNGKYIATLKKLKSCSVDLSLAEKLFYNMLRSVEKHLHRFSVKHKCSIVAD